MAMGVITKKKTTPIPKMIKFAEMARKYLFNLIHSPEFLSKYFTLLNDGTCGGIKDIQGGDDQLI